MIYLYIKTKKAEQVLTIYILFDIIILFVHRLLVLHERNCDVPKRKKSKEPKAVVRMVGGQLVLTNPPPVAIARAVEKHNCRNTLELNADRVAHFKTRLEERGMAASDAVIVVMNVDDVHGGPLADALMPGFNWQEIRDRREIPFARGLAGREGIQKALELFDKEAAVKLRGLADVAVVVVDHGVAEVFPA
jgi:hypothetical protein